jgi:lipoprotein NlpD
MLVTLAACSSNKPMNRAPVEERGPSVGKLSAPAAAVTSAPVASASAPEAESKPPLPGAENAGKPGYYTVKPGDTLIRIGLENGQSWRDVVRWNNLDNPNRIEVGQVLRIIPPGITPPTDTGVVTKPVVTASAPTGTALPAAAGGAVGSAPNATATAPSAMASAPVAAASAASAPSGDEGIAWIWPTNGALINGFDDAKNKGLDLAGKAGDPVYAAADGRVVYAGAGLRGYGNLIILKHNNTYLTAYAHNQTLLIKEDQPVRKGQKIAEMGNSDADRVKLHFEIRRQGKPVDPARYLPAR